ncbi:MAG TPA: TonB family protein [Burkholderiales bacterium]|nr:TonB family protein [Burkholderiales bacterium]
MQRVARREEAWARAAGRIALALLLSAALHLALVARLEISVGRQPAAAPSLQARLEPQPAPVSPPKQPVRPPARPPSEPAPSMAPMPMAAAPPQAAQQVAEPLLAEQGRAAEQTVLEPAPAIEVPIDPVYYAVHELDIYPMPLSAVRLESTAVPGGNVRVLVLIDETGWVTRAEIFEAQPPGVLDEAALQALRAARFSPARKDGRAVRSRVLIELAFDAPERD